MNDLKKLIAAAKRHEKDLQQQKHLSELVDQWAAAETAPEKSTHRRALWLSMDIAAGILLMVSIGLRALQPQPSTNHGTIVAKINSFAQSVRPEPSSDIDNPAPTTHKGSIHKPKNEATATISSTAERDITQPMIAEDANPVDYENYAYNDSIIEDTPTEQVQLADNTPVTKPKKTVYERTSNRLVATKHSPNTRRQASDDNRPILALTNSSTSITYEIGKINF